MTRATSGATGTVYEDVDGDSASSTVCHLRRVRPHQCARHTGRRGLAGEPRRAGGGFLNTMKVRVTSTLSDNAFDESGEVYVYRKVGVPTGGVTARPGHLALRGYYAPCGVGLRATCQTHKHCECNEIAIYPIGWRVVQDAIVELHLPSPVLGQQYLEGWRVEQPGSGARGTVYETSPITVVARGAPRTYTRGHSVTQEIDGVDVTGEVYEDVTMPSIEFRLALSSTFTDKVWQDETVVGANAMKVNGVEIGVPLKVKHRAS